MKITYMIFILIGIFMALLGWLINKFKVVEILSSYNLSKEYKRDELAKFAGYNFIYMGIIIIVSNIAFLLVSLKTSDFTEIPIIIFLVDVLFFSFRIAFGTSKFEIKEEEHSTADSSKKMSYSNNLTIVSKAMIIIAIVVVVTPVSILLFEERMAKTNLNILDNEIEIKAGLADRYYKSNAITDVYLKDTIPKFNKINGVDMGNINRGKFNVQGLGEGFLFLESSKGPYLYIIMGKDFVIINDKDEQKIKHFYTELLKYKKKLIYNY